MVIRKANPEDATGIAKVHVDSWKWDCGIRQRWKREIGPSNVSG